MVKKDFDLQTVKINVVVRWWMGGAFRISLYDEGRLVPNEQAKPVNMVSEVLHRVNDAVREILDRVRLLNFLQAGDPVGDPFVLAIEFFPPAGGRKLPTVSYRLFVGGDVELEKDPLILPLPGLDHPGSLVMIPDQIAAPLVCSMLQFVIYAIQHNPVVVLATAGEQPGAIDG